MINLKDLEGDRGLILMNNPGIRLEGLSESTKNLSYDSRFSGRDLNRNFLIRVGVLTTRPRRSV
jgi:hypothetical protein